MVHSISAELALKREARLWVVTALAAHPLFFALSFSYMTEVPFVFFSAGAVFFFVRYERTQSVMNLILACLLAVAATFVRQNGIIVPVAMLTAIVITRPAGWRRDLAIVGGTAVALAASLFAGLLTSSEPELAAHLGAPSPLALAHGFWEHALAHGTAALQHAALFFLPCVVLAGWPRTLPFRWKRAVLLAAGLAFAIRPLLALVGLSSVPAWSPFFWEEQDFGSLFINLGIGVPTLPDVRANGFAYPFSGEGAAQTVFTLVAFAAGIAAVAWLISVGPRFRFLQILAALGVLLLCLSTRYFDRYSLVALWMLPLLLVPAVANGVDASHWRRWAFSFLSVVFIAFNAGATGEWLSWNRARWAAVDAHRAAGGEVARLDGGYEVNAFVRVWNGRPVLDARLESITAPTILSFRPLDGYQVLRRHGFCGFRGARCGEVLTLERFAGAADRGSRSVR